MKALASTFIYLSVMVTNVFYILESDKKVHDKDLICHKDISFNPEIFLNNFIK
jgi:hypothetical protein